MPLHDAAATAALAEPVRFPVWFGFADLDGAPVRLTSAGHDVSFAPAATGDDDLDGFSFATLDGGLIEVSEIRQSASGSEAVTVTLSALPEIDAETNELLADAAAWRGRALRLWKWERDEAGEWQGAIVALPVFRLSHAELTPSPAGSTLQFKAETYLAAMTAQPSNRTYLGQKDFDPDDVSAAASIGAANGVKAGPGASVATIAGAAGGFAGAMTRALVKRL